MRKHVSLHRQPALAFSAVQGRYNENLFLSVLNCFLQGIAERPLPCNYYVIQLVCALVTAVTRVQIPSGTPTNSNGYLNASASTFRWEKPMITDTVDALNRSGRVGGTANTGTQTGII